MYPFWLIQLSELDRSSWAILSILSYAFPWRGGSRDTHGSKKAMALRM